jgi:acetoin utilization protein AcuC
VKTVLIYSPAWARFDYGPEHPLRMERLGLTWRLIDAYGLAGLLQATVVAPEPAGEAMIARFHAAEYLEVLKQVSSGAARRAQAVLHAAQHGLGPGDNPIFPGLWDAARLVAGGSLLAAELVGTGAITRVFHFAGGLHHAMRDRASGFCYVNDAVLAILRLRELGLRVAYVDIDAHHGDGVQAAFYDDPDVLTISTHERGDRLFPGTGFVDESGEGAGRGFSVNLPLHPFTDDAVYQSAFEEVVPPLLQAFRPEVVVAQLGIDSHATDPLTHLALSVQGFARIVARIVALAPRLVALGGGGYDLPNVARAWTAAWAVMNDVELPERLPEQFAGDMRKFGFRSPHLWDPAFEIPRDMRRACEEYAERQVAAIRRSIFPLHGIQ